MMSRQIASADTYVNEYPQFDGSLSHQIIVLGPDCELCLRRNVGGQSAYWQLPFRRDFGLMNLSPAQYEAIKEMVGTEAGEASLGRRLIVQVALWSSEFRLALYLDMDTYPRWSADDDVYEDEDEDENDVI